MARVRHRYGPRRREDEFRKPVWLKGLKPQENGKTGARAAKFIPRERGLGAPLGKGIVRIAPIDWISREEQWSLNRRALEERFPKIFSSGFFYGLQRIGGRKEGEVRLMELDLPFISVGKPDPKTGKKKPIEWNAFAVKKFQRRAKSNPLNQARTLHSLNAIRGYLIANSQWPKTSYPIRVVEAIAFKGPFFVMGFLGGKARAGADFESGRGVTVSADRLPDFLRGQVFKIAITIGESISNAEARLVKQFKSAGITYPSPDFIPSNFLARVRRNRIESLWIIDQFSGAPGTSTGRRMRSDGIKRMTDRQRWGLPAKK